MHNRAKTARTAFFVLCAVIIFATTLSPTLGDHQANSATHEAVDGSISNFSNSPTIRSVTNVTRPPNRPPNYNESVPIEAHVTDDLVNVSTVILSYFDGTTWFNVTMVEEIPQTDLYNATIPAFPWRTQVGYKVYANNTDGEWSSSDLYGYEVADYYPPIISGIYHYPWYPECDETVTVYAKVGKPENASWVNHNSVELRYSEHPYSAKFRFVDWVGPKTGLYNATIPALPWKTHVLYWVYAEDWAVPPNNATKPGPGEDPKDYWVLDSYGPSISNISHAPTSPQYNETVTVSANVSEPQTGSGVSNVTLSYFDGSKWRNVTMTEQGSYTAEIPALPWNTIVKYKVYARDNAANWATSDTRNYTVTDSHAPNIEDINWDPKEPKTNKPVVVTAPVSEPTSASGISTVILSYHDGSAWTNVTMTPSNGIYTAQIPGLKNATHVRFKIYARDNAGNWATSPVQEYTVKASEPSMILPLIVTIIVLVLVVTVAIMAMRKLKM